MQECPHYEKVKNRPRRCNARDGHRGSKLEKAYCPPIITRNMEEFQCRENQTPERRRALEASGIIRGYQAILDPQASTGGMTFVVNIETEAAQFAAIKDAMAAAPETLTLMQTTGSCHLLALCYAPSVADMRLFVRALYQRTPGILSISAHSVLDLIKGFIAPGISNFEVYEHD